MFLVLTGTAGRCQMKINSSAPLISLTPCHVIDLTQTCASISVISPVVVLYGEVKDM